MNSTGAAVGEVYQQPRLQQMLLVLHSQVQRVRTSLSLTMSPPTLDPAEHAIRKLLDALFLHRSAGGTGYFAGSFGSNSSRKGNGHRLGSRSKSPFAVPLPEKHAPTFQSSGVPRDRRGRVSAKTKSLSESGHGLAAHEFDSLSLPPSSPSTATASGTVTSMNGYGAFGASAFRRGHPLDDDDDFGGDGGGSTPRGRFSADRQRERTQSGHEPGDERSDEEPPPPPARTRLNGYQVDYRSTAVFEDADAEDERAGGDRQGSFDSDWDRAQVRGN